MTPLATIQSASAISRGINGQAPAVTRYLARVDERLAKLPNAAARRVFLSEQIDHQQGRYIEFQRLVNAGRDPGDVMAFDYVETIAALDKRLGECARAA